MPATARQQDDIFADDAESNAASAIDAQGEDAYWSRCCHLEGYFRAGLDYEDYAAAYCVGYIGYAQYGGAFEDAEKSLCSNWVRLKGDSRLSVSEAMLAIRAAWNRMEAAAAPAPQWDELFATAGEVGTQPARAPAANMALL